ncbi:hypothetical protein [Sinorhizobium psoraleae]|uniref:Transposase n=1 Tax=Sinorhizobium psoraleae TaxID=520838 RepID=A0ABT4KAI4_9HYPH|nr:hypothetical protein [Sinorhizobium psoraleae]MCZ4088844.1 hypothetical protein [Sinorhizobium psoraleae]
MTPTFRRVRRRSPAVGQLIVAQETINVECFRNIPALLWIIVVALRSCQEAMLTPNAFRGENPAALDAVLG